MRVLVDTNIWIDHLRQTEPVLVDLLERLMIVRNVDDQGVRHLVEERRLWGRGLSAVDVALLASALVTPGVALWTRDKRLRQAARDVGVLVDFD